MPVTRTDQGLDIQVPLPEALTELLRTPRYAEIALPEPGNVKLDLPTGSMIKGIGDVTQGIPTDYALNFSLMLQLGPILANLECFIRLLKLIEPLIAVIKGLPFPPVKAIKKFGEAAVDVTECIVKFTTPAGMIPFVKDILLISIRTLGSLVDGLQNIISVMKGISVDLADAVGNPTQQALLEVAQGNAQRSADAQLQAVEPVMVILGIAAPIFEIAQVGPIEIPTLGGVEGVEEMDSMVGALGDFVDSLQLIADALP